MKLLVILLVFAFCLFVLGGYVTKRILSACPGPTTNYIPLNNTFIEEQEQPAYVMGMYKDMFHKLNPWWDTTAHKAALLVGKQQPYALGERPKNTISGQNTNRDDYLNQFFG